MSGVNKIIFGDETLLDISEDTVSPYRLLKGYKAHTADGTQVDGLYDPNATNILTTRIITVNGTYEADDDRALGYSEVSVNVPGTFYKRLIEKNGTYTAEAESVDGFSEVRVDTEEAEPAEYNTTINDVLQERDLDFYTSSHVIGQVPYFAQSSCVVVYDNHIHLLGGGGNNKTKHYYLNDNNVWESVSTLPYNFEGGCAVIYEDTIHILSGSGGQKSHYKWNGTSWDSVSTLPFTYSCSHAVVYNNEIHTFSNMETTHYKWDGSEWTTASTLPETDVVPFCYDGYIYTFNISEDRYDYEIDKRVYAIRRWNGTTWDLYFETGVYLYGSKWFVKDQYAYITTGAGILYKWDFINEISEEAMMGNFHCGNMISLNDKIHAIGSDIDSRSRNASLKYDYLTWDLSGNNVTNQWMYEHIQNIYTSYNNANANAATIYNDELYVVGFNDSEMPSISKYNGTTWYHDPIPLPENMYLPAISLLTYSSNLYMFISDYHETGELKLHRYDNNNNAWDVIGSLDLDPGCGYCGVVYDGYIHVMAIYSDGVKHPTLYRFINNEWDEVSTIDDVTYSLDGYYSVFFPSLAVYDNAIHMVLGNDDYHYKWDGTSWSVVSELPFTNEQWESLAPRLMTYDDELQLFLSDATHYRYINNQWVLISQVPVFTQRESYHLIPYCVKSFKGSIILMMGNEQYTMSQETYDNCTTPGYYAKFKKVGKKCYTLRQDI